MPWSKTATCTNDMTTCASSTQKRYSSLPPTLATSMLSSGYRCLLLKTSDVSRWKCKVSATSLSLSRIFLNIATIIRCSRSSLPILRQKKLPLDTVNVWPTVCAKLCRSSLSITKPTDDDEIHEAMPSVRNQERSRRLQLSGSRQRRMPRLLSLVSVRLGARIL